MGLGPEQETTVFCVGTDMWGVVCTAAFHCVLVTLINKRTVTFTGGHPAVVTGNCRDTFVVFGAHKFYMNQKCNMATKKVDAISRCVNSKGGDRQFEVVTHSHRSEKTQHPRSPRWNFCGQC